MRNRRIILIALLLVVACCNRCLGLTAEAIGLRAESAQAAASNTIRLNDYFAKYQGDRGDVHFLAKNYYFIGVVKTAARNGSGRLVGSGSGTLTSEDSGSSVTRLVDLDGGKFFILRGVGFTLEALELQGRRWASGEYPNTPVSESLVEVEGRHNPATGLHLLHSCTFSGAKVAIRTVPGYYDSDAVTLIPAEAHADQSRVEGCHFFNIGTAFQSENQQSLDWSFRDCDFNSHWSGDFTDAGMVVFDIARGGAFRADGLNLNHNRITLFRVRDYSHNTQYLSAANIQWDNFNKPTDYLTLFEYAGPVESQMRGYQWSVRVTGAIGNCYPDPYNVSKLVVIPPEARKAGFPVSDLRFDIARMPETNFTRESNWLVPK